MIETIAIGHLGRNALINDVNGKKVINFSVAHSEKFKDHSGQVVEKTIWVECAWWRENTGVAQYLTRGTQVFVRGIPSVETFRNKDGIIIPKLRLRVKELTLLGAKKETGDNQTKEPSDNRTVNDSEMSGSSMEPVDDLPF
jgi:single-strand DNA-binding protein